jgi:tRNA threonylcarbamoyladenosine biosynthesis protein TsaB
MRVLSIDTSTVRGSISLLEGEDVVAGLRSTSLETHSARLLRGIDFLLAAAGWTLGDIELVACSKGPGSFTGVRIGLSTALGLAQTLRVPLAAVSTLDAVAHGLRFLKGRLAVVMDAQRSQLYCAEYILGGGRSRCDVKPALLEPGDIARRIRKRRTFVAGDGVARYREAFGASLEGWPRVAPSGLFIADELGRLAQLRRRHWRTGEWLSVEPLYVRPPDALKPKRRAGP